MLGLNRVILRRSSLIRTPCKNITGFFFTRQAATPDIVKGKSVVVYEGPEWKEMNEFLNTQNYFDIVPKDRESVKQVKNIWQDCVMNSRFQAKYFALLPFFLEDRQTSRAQKKFVLKMELYPETKYLKFTFAMMSGIYERYEPLIDVVPVTPGDYRIRHLVLRSRPPHFVDMDMVYGNRKVIDMYCFDKEGTWVKEGVENPVLKLENSYKEQNWFDHLNWNNQWL